MSATSEVSAELRSGAWATGLPTSGPGSDACAQLPGIVGVVLQYVQPLREWFDDLLGRAAEVEAAALSWEDASRALAAVPDTLVTARNALAELDGRTVRALRQRHDDLHAVAVDAAEWTAATGAAIRLASRIVDATRSFVCDALVQLAQFADSLFSFTLDPFEVADRVREFANAANDLIDAAGRLVVDVLESLAALGVLLNRLLPMLDDALASLQKVLAQMMPGMGAFGGFIAGGLPGAAVGYVLGGAGQDFLQGDTRVSELDPASLTPTQLDAYERAHGVTSLGSLSDLVGVNGTTDEMGGADATTIDVKKVIGPDGTEHWVVSLPSTQDWTGGAGALNDRDSNVALMLDNPAFRGVYERAVLQAMSDAGVPPGGDVVLTGFSQGGIMAANLASDRTFPYNTVGVVTNGSPVDSFDVPPHIPVYAFQHATDVVPTLDGNAFGSTPDNVHRVVLPGPVSPLEAHNNSAYTESVRQWEQQYAAVNGSPPPGIDVFTGEVVDHSVFTTRE